MAVPLISSTGHRVGTLCIADLVPRAFSGHDIRLLSNFAELAARLLEQSQQLEANRVVAQQEPALSIAFGR